MPHYCGECHAAQADFCEKCQGWYGAACEGCCSYCAFWDQQQSDDDRDWAEEWVGGPVDGREEQAA